MDFSSVSVIGFVALAVAAVLREYLINFCRILFANIFRSGQYNLDGDPSTPDWCEMVNDNAEWFMVKILEYHFFYRLVQVRDAAGGLHDMRIMTLDFINAQSRELSREQRVAVSKAGNDWPPMPVSGAAGVCRFRSCDRLASVVEKMAGEVATKVDVGAIVDMQKILRELAEWREKRPTALGRHQKVLLDLNNRVSKLEMDRAGSASANRKPSKPQKKK